MKTKTNARPFKFLTYAVVMGMSLMISCKKHDAEVGNTPDPAGISGLLAMATPDGFNYQTDTEVQVDVTVLAPDDQPLADIPVSILDKPEDEGGTVYFTAMTDAQGKITGAVKLPAYITEMVVDPAYIGVIRNATVKVTANALTCVLGGNAGFGGNVIPDHLRLGRGELTTTNGRENTASLYKYLGTYDTAGRPNYLLAPNDVISPTLLSFMNASLPESKAVSTYHPDYLKATTETNLNIKELSDVTLTFVGEGASKFNTIAYFTYPTGRPPASQAEVDSLKIILPNASLNGSGGKLLSGNRVYLGRFQPGISIGFALIASGWNTTTKSVGGGSYKLFSIDKINPEALASQQRHSILLHYPAANLFLVGMEDARRDIGSDNDFNDVTFYLKSNPVTAISTTNVNSIDQSVDTDGDGVSDFNDKFPTDATRAYISYYPAEQVYGTLAFEDNWPNLGDYDMNDMVIRYRYSMINNAQNKTVEMFANYILQAAGASNKNGFGIEFPFAASLVQSVTGTRVVNGSIVTLAGNGCESGNTKAVIIPFDNTFSVTTATGFLNTLKTIPYQAPDTVKMKIRFTSPLTATTLGTTPFNPFAFINKTRGREVHLAGYTPTAKANISLFGTGKDHTVPAQNIYYKTSNGLPFAISFSETFNYPEEYITINDAYRKFITWAQSSATSNRNWYKDSGYMVQSKLFHK